MPNIHDICTEVSPHCPVEATTYGYRPNLGANILFAVIFGLCAVAQVVAGIKYRIRGFAIAIAFQVATMFVCICLAADFGWRSMRSRRGKSEADVYDQSTVERDSKGGEMWFQISCVALAASFVAIFVRCIYRIPEMAGGWGGPRMQDEVAFMILESGFVAVAVLLVTIAYPVGIFCTKK